MKRSTNLLVFVWILIGALSRILPHPANMTAMTSLSLLVGREYSKIRSICIVLASLLLSDLMLAHVMGYPILGTWSLFTYSGFVVIALLGCRFQATGIRLFGVLIGTSFLFWLWTNFGTWLLSDLYSKDFAGLWTCYVAALPFLRNSLLGDAGWMLILLGILHLGKNKSVEAMRFLEDKS